MKKQVHQAQVIWDERSDPQNPGWVVRIRGDIYAPAPRYYHVPADAEYNMLRAMAIAAIEYHGYPMAQWVDVVVED
jgi:hypothetical protein